MKFIDYLQSSEIALGIATGRCIESAQQILQEWEVPPPDLWITSVGSEIYYLPLRASKGDAVNYCANKWNFAIKNILVAGDSGNDEKMLTSGANAVVVGNYSSELEKLRGQNHVYFATGDYAQGVLEAIAQCKW